MLRRLHYWWDYGWVNRSQAYFPFNCPLEKVSILGKCEIVAETGWWKIAPQYSPSSFFRILSIRYLTANKILKVDWNQAFMTWHSFRKWFLQSDLQMRNLFGLSLQVNCVICKWLACGYLWRDEGNERTGSNSQQTEYSQQGIERSRYPKKSKKRVLLLNVRLGEAHSIIEEQQHQQFVLFIW